MLRRLTEDPARLLPDAGDTLVELILTIGIVALTVVALLGAVLTSITGSTEHRALTVDNSLLNSYVQFVQNAVERQGDPSLFTGCASASDIPSPSADTSDTYTSSNGWAPVRITKIQYWVHGAGGFSSCPGGSPTVDLLLLTATETSPSQLSSSITFAVRNPQAA